MAVTGTVMPSPYQTVLSDAGLIISGALVWTYLAGTSTPQATYTDASLTTPNSNPIVADSAGRFVAFLQPGASYKFVVETAAVPPAHGSVIRTVDLVSSIPSSAANVDISGIAGQALTAGQVVFLSDGANGLNAGQWYMASNQNPGSSSAAPTIGIVMASIAAGATGTIRTQGTVTGLSVVAGATYYVGSASGTMTTTKPSSPAFVRVVGVADTTTSLVLSGLAPVSLIPPTLINNNTAGGLWTLPLTSNNLVVLWTGTVDTTMSGIDSTGVAPGTSVLIVNEGQGGNLFFPPQSTGIGGTSKLFNVINGGPTPVARNGRITYTFDAVVNMWRMGAHEQGGWIVRPFAASDYSASGGWTVASGNVLSHQYRLDGQILTVNLCITGTTLASDSAELFVTLPVGMLANFYTSATVGSGNDGAGSYFPVYSYCVPNQTSIGFRKVPSTAVAWKAGAIELRAVIMIPLS
jgi:hypothetical protein